MSVCYARWPEGALLDVTFCSRVLRQWTSLGLSSSPRHFVLDLGAELRVGLFSRCSAEVERLQIDHNRK